jgi:hypothetical protein
VCGRSAMSGKELVLLSIAAVLCLGIVSFPQIKNSNYLLKNKLKNPGKYKNIRFD